MYKREADITEERSVRKEILLAATLILVGSHSQASLIGDTVGGIFETGSRGYNQLNDTTSPIGSRVLDSY